MAEQTRILEQIKLDYPSIDSSLHELILGERMIGIHPGPFENKAKKTQELYQNFYGFVAMLANRDPSEDTSFWGSGDDGTSQGPEMKRFQDELSIFYKNRFEYESEKYQELYLFARDFYMNIQARKREKERLERERIEQERREYYRLANESLVQNMHETYTYGIAGREPQKKIFERDLRKAIESETVEVGVDSISYQHIHDYYYKCTNIKYHVFQLQSVLDYDEKGNHFGRNSSVCPTCTFPMDFRLYKQHLSFEKLKTDLFEKVLTNDKEIENYDLSRVECIAEMITILTNLDTDEINNCKNLFKSKLPSNLQV